MTQLRPGKSTNGQFYTFALETRKSLSNIYRNVLVESVSPRREKNIWTNIFYSQSSMCPCREVIYTGNDADEHTHTLAQKEITWKIFTAFKPARKSLKVIICTLFTLISGCFLDKARKKSVQCFHLGFVSDTIWRNRVETVKKSLSHRLTSKKAPNRQQRVHQRCLFTCRWLTMQNGSGRFSPQVEVDESWWARPIRRSPVAG